MVSECSKTLPKTRTVSLCAQWKRCGKPGCRCAVGALHGPYYALFWRVDGRLRKRHVRQRDVAHMRALVAEHRQSIGLQREARRLYRHMWRQQLGELREYEQWLRRP